MAKFELKLPKMGESVAEATITSWLKNVGDTIEADEAVLEIATDKVDSEVPSEVDGILTEILFKVDDVVKVGQVIAIIETNASAAPVPFSSKQDGTSASAADTPEVAQITQTIEAAKTAVAAPVISTEDRFYSPLVKNIAKQEGVSQSELDQISGSGKDGRVTKNDLLVYLENKKSASVIDPQSVISESSKQEPLAAQATQEKAPEKPKVESVLESNGDEIIEMTRMGKLIAHHMVESIQKSAHVQSFMEAVAKALREFPMMNVSLQDDKIIKKKHINLGMAAALPDGNLIVPVIKDADQLNLIGMTKRVNDLANRARLGQLKPDDIQGGTYTVTNVGTFGSIMGTPIINQPQVGILALGAIRKVPAVVETPQGDFIGIRYRMFLSHSYDHRVVNGALGGQFVKAVKDYLEAWDVNREI